MQARYYCIVNPISGSGRGKREFGHARALLDAAGANYAFAFTEYHLHAKELARAALASGERCIVAVGGDGTVNEIASVLQGTDAAMGILPFGTGNDFSQALHIPQDTAGAVAALLAASPRRWMRRAQTMRFSSMFPVSALMWTLCAIRKNTKNTQTACCLTCWAYCRRCFT